MGLKWGGDYVSGQSLCGEKTEGPLEHAKGTGGVYSATRPRKWKLV